VVTRALGGGSELAVDHWLLPAAGGDRFLICSDGLFGELSDEAIAALLAAAHPQQAAGALVAAANEAGGRDNITALVVDVESADTPEFRPVQDRAPLGEPAVRSARPHGHAERGGLGGALERTSGGPRGTCGSPPASLPCPAPSAGCSPSAEREPGGRS
jgi:hypothetical protein